MVVEYFHGLGARRRFSWGWVDIALGALPRPGDNLPRRCLNPGRRAIGALGVTGRPAQRVDLELCSVSWAKPIVDIEYSQLTWPLVRRFVHGILPWVSRMAILRSISRRQTVSRSMPY